MKKLTFLLEDHQYDWLYEYAHKNHRSQSSIVRDALKEYQEAAGETFVDRWAKKHPRKNLLNNIPVKAKVTKVKKFKPPVVSPEIKEVVKKEDDHPGFCEHGAMIGNCKYGCKK